jgi:hypothetical protein
LQQAKVYSKEKKNGRPQVQYKVRSFQGITPKGFEFEKVSVKNKELVYRRVK